MFSRLNRHLATLFVAMGLLGIAPPLPAAPNRQAADSQSNAIRLTNFRLFSSDFRLLLPASYAEPVVGLGTAADHP